MRWRLHPPQGGDITIPAQQYAGTQEGPMSVAVNGIAHIQLTVNDDER